MPLHQRQMPAGGGSKVRSNMPSSDSARGMAEVQEQELEAKLVEGGPAVNGFGAKDHDDSGKPCQRDSHLRGNAQSFARLHKCD